MPEMKFKNIIINNNNYEVIYADSFYKRLFGLMNKKDIDKGMFFPKTNSIHTFFMKDDIDIVMINKNNEVVYYEKKCRKNKIIIKKNAYHTIELPKNSLKDIKKGDLVIIN